MTGEMKGRHPMKPESESPIDCARQAGKGTEPLVDAGPIDFFVYLFSTARAYSKLLKQLQVFRKARAKAIVFSHRFSGIRCLHRMEWPFGFRIFANADAVQCACNMHWTHAVILSVR